MGSGMCDLRDDRATTGATAVKRVAGSVHGSEAARTEWPVLVLVLVLVPALAHADDGVSYASSPHARAVHASPGTKPALAAAGNNAVGAA